MSVVKNAGTGLLVIVMVALSIVLPIVLLILSIKMSVLLIPWLFWIGVLIFALNLITSPLAFFRKTQMHYGVFLTYSSILYGITLWFCGLLVAYVAWGLWGILVGLMFAGIGVVPVAMLAALLHGEWFTFLFLIIMAVATFGIRILGIFITVKAEETQEAFSWQDISASDSSVLEEVAT